MSDKLKKALFISTGLLCVGLGGLGIILPILPTTPFLLLAVYLFTSSSEKLRHWLLHHKIFGRYIYNYTVHKAIPLKSKITAIATLWVTMIISMVVSGKIVVVVILTLIGSAVTAHLLRMKTLSDKDK